MLEASSSFSVAPIGSEIDKTDIKIIELMILGETNKHIALSLKIPLSTVQRRTRKIIEKEIVMQKLQLNYEKFGLRTGLIHIYLREGNIEKICKNVSEIRGITSVEVHIGNSDIIANLAYKESKHMLDAILRIKEMDGINRVIWSERVLQYPVKNNNGLLNS
ncbi:MAG: hypothetical protein M3162_07520 [Thermoproteota archaeon]|nr:hypothetical protein [Thermoproteota archaeon]